MGRHAVLPRQPAPLRRFLTPYLVDKIHNDIILLYTETVEMLPNSRCQRIFALPLRLYFSDHGRGVLPYAAGPRKHRVVKRADQGGRGA